MSERCDALVIGGGAAGFFGAIRAKELAPKARVVILEGSPRPLQKVRISGGGRCNLTHACFDLPQLLSHYPRGHKQLRPLLSRFGPRDTMQWFERHGVALKIEADGRVFPADDSSDTIVSSLLRAARQAGVELHCSSGVTKLTASGAGYRVTTRSGDWLAPNVLLATGGSPAPRGWLSQLGHSWVEAVPSLFTFTLAEKRFLELAGLTLPEVKATLALSDTVQQTGPLLFTHWGLSGPVILKLSSWCARELADASYKALLRLDLVPQLSQDEVRQQLLGSKRAHRQKSVGSGGPLPLPRRLWQALCHDFGARTWGETPDRWLNAMAETCKRLTLEVVGKGVFKEEFVMAGGVPLEEVMPRTLESRLRPGLFLAGEVLNVDGLTGGFNLQNAWSGGCVAGQGMAERML